MSNNKIKVLTLYGKSGSGKNTIYDWMLSNFPNMFHYIVPSTTREPRKGEIDGVNYHFLDEETFLNTRMAEQSYFARWYYGTSWEEFYANKINIGIFNPSAIQQLLEKTEFEVYPILIQSSDKMRLIRILEREPAPDCEEIFRRFEADKKDFENLSFKPFYTWGNFSNEDHSNSWRKIFNSIISRIYEPLKDDKGSMGQN